MMEAQILEELRRIRRAVERPPAPRFLTVAEAAEALAVSESYIYAHAEKLGAVRLPSANGSKPRLRFDAERLRALGSDQPAEKRKPRKKPYRGELKIRGKGPE